MTKQWALVLALLPSLAHARMLYVATTGADGSNDCSNAGAPCATITYAIQSMAGGDVLVVGDGTYAESITRMPSGSSSAYTTIMAAHDWAVTIDGSGFPNDYNDGIRVGSVSYVAVRGFHVVMNQANDANLGVDVYDSDHVRIQRCSVAYSGTIGNVAAFGIGPASDYVLVEESYVYGGARYPFLVYQSTHTVMRRNVSRLDYWNGTLQAANFTNYNGDDTVWQNNIAIDSDTADIAGSGLYGGFFNENKVPDATWSGTATRETYRGNIVLNVQAFYSGMYDYDVSNLHTYSDNIIWDSHGGYYGDYIHGDPPVLDASRFTIGQIRGSYDAANGQGSAGTGFFIGVGTDGTRVVNTLTDSILCHNPSLGMADYASGDYNALWANTMGNYGGRYATPAAGSHDLSGDQSASLRYLPRIEPGSMLSTRGSGGGAIGANVELMWGATGTLWGEPGYDSITSEPLWPFPNEDVISADMASYSGPGGAGARGFATGNSIDGSPQTLTKYIWEYLGNQIPDDVYGFHIVTTSLPDGVVGVAYQATLSAAGGTAPYAWSLTSGTLPAGLAIDPSSGIISGTPTAAASASFTVRAMDSESTPETQSRTLGILISATAPIDAGVADGGNIMPRADGGTITSSAGCGCMTARGSAGASLAPILIAACCMRRRRSRIAS